MRCYAFFLLVLLGVIAVGCGGHSGNGNPAVPGVTDPVIESRSGSSHVLWGMWEVVINPTGTNTADVELVPLRGAMFNSNVQKFLTPPEAPINLLTFDFLSETDFPAGYVKVNVGIVHPFVGLAKFRGFDVRCIFMADAETYGLHDPDILYTKPMPNGTPTSGAYMLNPDGYTRWWNYPEFTDPAPILSFKPSVLGTDPEPMATLNPYKYFSDELDEDDPVSELPVESRGYFSPNGDINYRIHEIQFPTDPLNFGFNIAVDASWALPDPSGEPDYPVDSFPPDAQTQEPFHVKGTHTGGGAFYTDSASGGTIELDVTVYDWQAVGNPPEVPDEITSIWLEGEPLASPVDVLPLATVNTGPNEASSVFHVELDNSMLDLNSAGDFVLLGTIESADPSTYIPQITGGDNFIYPDEVLSAYFMMTVNVIGTPPIITVILPNGGEYLQVGSYFEIQWSGGEIFDSVKLEYSKDDFVSDVNVIIESTDNTGAFLWEDIPDDPSETVKVRVSATGATSANDESDDYFTITNESPVERIVYRGDGPVPNYHIYSIDPEGLTEPEQWTFGTEPAFRECAKLSPCGKYILYTFCNMDVGEIRLIDVVTKEVNLVNPPGKQAIYGDFSHDGTKIVTAAADIWYGPFELWAVDYNGDNAEELTTDADAWGPEYNFDDSKIYFMEFTTSQICIYDVATGFIEHYTDNGGSNESPVGDTVDGSQIAWATSVGSGCRRIYISPITSWDPPDLIIEFDNCVRSPCWSPDGSRILIDHGMYDGSELAIYDLSDDTWADITDNAWGDYQADWGIMVPH